MIEEKSEKLAELKLRKQQLEQEKQRLANIQDRVKMGDKTALKRLGEGPNIGLLHGQGLISDFKHLQAQTVPAY